MTELYRAIEDYLRSRERGDNYLSSYYGEVLRSCMIRGESIRYTDYQGVHWLIIRHVRGERVEARRDTSRYAKEWDEMEPNAVELSRMDRLIREEPHEEEWE